MNQTQSQTVTSSQQDTPAHPSVSLGSKKAQKMTATSGRTLAKLLHSKDPLGLFSKMFMATSHWVSTKCYLTWKIKVSPQGRLLCLLAVSMPPTEEIDSSLWATPNTMDYLPQRSPEALKKLAEGERKGRALPSNLREQVDPETVEAWKKLQEPTFWATPIAANAVGSSRPPSKGGGSRDLRQDVKMWPTPLARDHKGGYLGGRIRNGKVSMDSLDVAVQHTDNQNKTGGLLNPWWVEWLMGYPRGWTDLKD